MEPREHHFFFAKQMIPTHAFRSPDQVFGELTGPKREAFLMYLWTTAAQGIAAPVKAADVGKKPGSAEQAVVKLDVVGAIRQNGLEVVVVSMPPALAPNEAIFLALVRGGDGPLRVFFYERCRDSQGGVSESEAVLACVSADGTRSNLGFFQGDGLEHFKTNLGNALGISLQGLETSLPPVTIADFMGGAGAGGVGRSGAAGQQDGLGGILEKTLLVRAGMPPVFWLFGLVLPGVIGMFAKVLNPLLSFAIWVMLVIWLYKIMDARRGKTSYSPGMAVGAWFIPLGNLVLPPLVLRDAWKAVRGPAGSGIVFGWWAVWLLETSLRVLFSLGFSFVRTVGSPVAAMHIAGARFEVPASMMSLGTVLSYLSLLTGIGAYALLWVIVRKINEKA